MENGVALRKLIREKAGPASPGLLPYFARASAHFTILELAHKGSLKGSPEKFKDYVYPRQLDGVLDRERTRLEKRGTTIRAKIAEEHPPIPVLVTPPELALDDLPAPAAWVQAERAAQRPSAGRSSAILYQFGPTTRPRFPPPSLRTAGTRVSVSPVLLINS